MGDSLVKAPFMATETNIISMGVKRMKTRYMENRNLWGNECEI